ncbi:MAG TPA: XRE family transcriptional regulator [Thermoanaerobaculia bacterium]|jgi:Zn-dependent peptidase ImmA (M78 family)/DNA-binding XRE family transcriptional regulator|nr:XRE family transcriptional regulator [Thermoanaerobaculia bacterium]
MRTGTPGFVPERLSRAREARALTVNSLAEMIDVSRQSLSAYESGKQTPGTAVLDRLAQTLNVPVRHFTTPLPILRAFKFSYRSLNAATKRSRTKAQNRFYWFDEILEWVESVIEFPSSDIPDFDIPNPLLLTDRDIEDIAGETRRKWGLGNGPIGDMIALLESHGIIVTKFPLDSDHLDSFCAHGRDLPSYIMLNSEKESAVRLRLDAAHELGHAVLHRGCTFNAGDHKRAEAQAFRFGAAFLFPEASFLREAVSLTLPSFFALKRRWKVSAAMMLKRAGDLELLQPEQSERLWRYYSSKGYGRRGETYDDVIPVERPQLLSRAFEMILNEGLSTREQILEAIPLYSNEIEELCSLERGFLKVAAPVAELKPRQNSLVFGSTGDGGTVIPFRGQKD